MTDTTFQGAFAGYANNLQWSEDGGEDGEAKLRPHLQRFAVSVGGPWPAACSLWGQIYFNALLTLATCMLASDAPVDARANRLRTRFCPENGTPLGFSLCGLRRCEPLAKSSFIRLLDTHLGSVIDEVVAEGGLSKRLLWESVDHALRWTVGEIAKNQPHRIPQLERLAQEQHPELRLRFPIDSRHRSATVARKFCCLRYRLNGHFACPGICPHVKA